MGVRVLLLATAVVQLAPAVAHHSNAGMDMDAVAQFEGTVTDYHWRNRHVHLKMLTTE